MFIQLGYDLKTLSERIIILSGNISCQKYFLRSCRESNSKVLSALPERFVILTRQGCPTPRERVWNFSNYFLQAKSLSTHRASRGVAQTLLARLVQLGEESRTEILR